MYVLRRERTATERLAAPGSGSGVLAVMPTRDGEGGVELPAEE